MPANEFAGMIRPYEDAAGCVCTESGSRLRLYEASGLVILHRDNV